MKIRFHNGLLFALIVALKVTASPLNGVPESQLKSNKVVPSPLVIPASQYFVSFIFLILNSQTRK